MCVVLSVVSVPASPAWCGALLQWPKTAATRAACTASSCRRGASCSFRPRASCSTTTPLRPPSTSCRHTPSSGQYVLSTHSILRSVHPVDTLHRQVSTSCRHTPSSGQYSSFHAPSLGQHSLSTHSIRSVHLLLFFPRSIVRSVHLVNAPSAGQYILSTHSSIRSVHLIFSRLVDILHHQVSTPCRHTPSSGQYSLSRHSMIKSVHPVDTTPSSGQYTSSFHVPSSGHGASRVHARVHWVNTSHLHSPSLGQNISSSHATGVWVLYTFTIHRQVSTSHLHMPWLCGYCTSSHSMIRAKRLIFTCHGCVGTVHLPTPSSGQYIRE